MKKKRIFIGLLVGIIIGAPTSYFVTKATIEASKITYDITESGAHGATKTNVQEAMDEIYDIAIAKQANPPVIRYADGEIVYFNPVTGTKCTSSDYSVSNSSTNYKGDGCMRWFAYLDDGSDMVKLLLDHNTTATVQWYRYSSYVTYENSKAKPEIGNLVSPSGSNWKVDASDDTIAIKSIGCIDAKDIAKITGKTNNNSTWDSTIDENNQFYFDSNTSTAPATYGKYWWLNDRTYGCTSYGCVTEDNSSHGGRSTVNGYWTSTNIGTSGSYVWIVSNQAHLSGIDATWTSIGVRPVITVLRSKL